MTLKITLTIDQENEQGTVLLGLLAKAFGRGEAGIGDLRIERAAAPALRGGAEYQEGFQQVARKAVGKVRLVEKKPKATRQGYELGMRAMRNGKPNGVIVTLRVLRDGGSLPEVRDAWREAGLVADGGVGATLSKLRKRGLVNHVGASDWQIATGGLETLRKFEEGLQHDAKVVDDDR